VLKDNDCIFVIQKLMYNSVCANSINKLFSCREREKPELNVRLPKLNIRLPKFNVRLPKLNIRLPKFNVRLQN